MKWYGDGSNRMPVPESFDEFMTMYAALCGFVVGETIDHDNQCYVVKNIGTNGMKIVVFLEMAGQPNQTREAHIFIANPAWC